MSQTLTRLITGIRMHHRFLTLSWTLQDLTEQKDITVSQSSTYPSFWSKRVPHVNWLTSKRVPHVEQTGSTCELTHEDSSVDEPISLTQQHYLSEIFEAEEKRGITNHFRDRNFVGKVSEKESLDPMVLKLDESPIKETSSFSCFVSWSPSNFFIPLTHTPIRSTLVAETTFSWSFKLKAPIVPVWKKFSIKQTRFFRGLR